MNNIHFERVQSFQYFGATFTTNGDGAFNIKQSLVKLKVHVTQQNGLEKQYC